MVSCDIIYLYKEILQDFNYKNIEFIKLSKLREKIKKYDRLHLYEDNYYTSFALNKKFKKIDELSFEPIIIGLNNTNYKHYSDKYFIWNVFLRYFTKN